MKAIGPAFVLGLSLAPLVLQACGDGVRAVDAPSAPAGGDDDASTSSGPGTGTGSDDGGGGVRDGGTTGSDGGPTANAPVVEQATFTTLYAASDLHAHYAQLGALLVRWHLAPSAPVDPTQITWSGGDATFVVTGDMIDKGPASLEVLEAVRALQASAAASGSGGRVIALLGNHEAEFLGTPTDSKFTGSDRIDDELAAQTPAVDPAAFASGADPRGAWLRTLPVAARVGSWFFAHAGDTSGATIAQLDTEIAAALASPSGYRSTALVGATSILESDGWYTSSGVVTSDLAALGVKHVAFGHDPNAFGSKGTMLAPSTYAGALVKLDTGLGSDASSGALLRVRHAGATDVAEALLPDGSTTPLWTGAP